MEIIGHWLHARRRRLQLGNKLGRLARQLMALLLLAVMMAACAPQPQARFLTLGVTPAPTPLLETPTAYPTRPPYPPGTLVDYVAQTGDTLPALAVRFNTTVPQILEANSFIPADATTMPPGMPMKIPIYYQALWGSPHQILPDGWFVNGPAQIGFDAAEFVRQQPGWLKQYSTYMGEQTRTGGEIVDYIATNYSISPRLLLALLEYQTGALTNPDLPAEAATGYLLGYRDSSHAGLEMQLIWAANQLNNGYYDWRAGKLTTLEHLDGRLERPDPWQNAATVALQAYFCKLLDGDAYAYAISSAGFQATYTRLFGDPWADRQDHIPGSLQQPALRLPFEAGKRWAFTGGPHTGWGKGAPFAALDFAPPGLQAGCAPTQEWARAVADGVVARTGIALLVLDLDGDGDERTGWTIFYLHLAQASLVRQGTVVRAGDPLGLPSCEGGQATGTHVHIARKYNGEWVLADGPLAFNLDGWVAHNGEAAYLGTLTRYGAVVTASVGAGSQSVILAGSQP
ncbi:MAG: LysM peptidoglycan-binding domain-containing M23 family metallopeptidase [Longilinea sp.]|nr:LysM peptidoglycan-binding domain-containing M23 family metallopeptidase [Longilinea sp.]